jgi:SRSO17 transposase
VAAVVSTVKVRPVRKRDPKPRRLSVEALALKLPKHAWRTITWREGTNKSLQSRFARVRVRAAPQNGEARFAEETLLTQLYQLAVNNPFFGARQPENASRNNGA